MKSHASTRLTRRKIRFSRNQMPVVEFVHRVAPIITNREARRVVVKAWSALRLPPGKRLISVVWINSKESRRLNVLYRGKDYPTNVLSFEYGMCQETRSSEIALCTEVIRREASELGIDVRAWATRLFIHGLLHTEGYRHDSESRQRHMERIERTILKECGYHPAMVPTNK